MAIGRITRDLQMISVNSIEGDMFVFRLMEDGSLEQCAAPVWSQNRQPSKAAGKARLLEARMAAAGWLAKDLSVGT